VVSHHERISAGDGQSLASGPLAWFNQMVGHCQAYAQEARAAGRPIIGILCEYAPRELILAAGGVPVCLCGGDAEMIPSAEAQLPACLCPLIKSTYGYFLEKSNPFLEMADLLVAETTCDGKKKMFELMAVRRATFLLELSQKEDDPASLAHWVLELRKFKEFLETRYHTVITDARLREAIRLMNRERSLRRRLAALLRADTPPLTGRQLLDFKSIISAIPADLAHYELALSSLSGAPPPPSGRRPRARVLLTGVPLVHGAERVLELIEQNGGLVVCQENCTGLKPILDDIPEQAPDLLQALAEKYYRLPCSIKTPNQGRFTLLRQLADQYRAECVIDLVWQGCLTYAVESFHVKRLTEETLGLPFLRIETDYSPSDSARLATRIGALVETVSQRRAAAPDTGRVSSVP